MYICSCHCYLFCFFFNKFMTLLEICYQVENEEVVCFCHLGLSLRYTLRVKTGDLVYVSSYL